MNKQKYLKYKLKYLDLKSKLTDNEEEKEKIKKK
jgi:hypothetical protein